MAKTVYLIMKVEQGNECLEYEPRCLVDDWGEWLKTVCPTYSVDIYEFVDGLKTKLVFSGEWCRGMALYYWWASEDPSVDKPHVVHEWPGRTKQDTVPPQVWEEIASLHAVYDWDGEIGIDNEMCYEGAMYWCDGVLGPRPCPVRKFVYGEYKGNKYACRED